MKLDKLHYVLGAVVIIAIGAHLSKLVPSYYSDYQTCLNEEMKIYVGDGIKQPSAVTRIGRIASDYCSRYAKK